MKSKARAIVRGLTLVLLGADLAIWYLDETLRPSVPQVHALAETALLVTLLVSIVVNFFNANNQQPGVSLPEPPPAISALIVIGATGAAAVYFLGNGFHTASDLIAPAAIVAAVVAIGLPVARFANRHRDEIGEARFKTGVDMRHEGQ